MTPRGISPGGKHAKPEDTEVLDVAGVAKMLGCSETTARRLMVPGGIAFKAPAKRKITTRRAVLHWIDGMGGLE